MAKFILLVVNSLFFQGLLDLQRYIEDPFGDDVIDFPEYGFHSRLKKEAETVMNGGKAYDELKEAYAYNPLPKPPAKPVLNSQVLSLLESLGYGEYAPIFAQEKIIYSDLASMDGMMVHSLGVPVGPAFSLAKAFKKLPQNFEDFGVPGLVKL